MPKEWRVQRQLMCPVPDLAARGVTVDARDLAVRHSGANRLGMFPGVSEHNRAP
jgi:hypothetical protein